MWGTLGPVAENVPRVANDILVRRISTLLEPVGRVEGNPIRLAENEGIAFHLPVSVEGVVEANVIPAVRGHCRHVDLDMDVTQSVDVRVAVDGGIVDQVVELRQSEPAAEHDRAPLVVQ
ncbi:hypothetical protein [Mycobacterium sp. Lab-001]|uniref:hypothetical protein n=1 Tax=Mycobacterium sp. Lab-001 TaxID=3410136 RepID=UPI003D16E329